jgi:hypothetical protein
MAAGSVQIVNPTSLTAATPTGGGGVVDVIVRDSVDIENQARLAAAFTYDDPLTIARVQPESGAIAGGTFVTVLGTGFGATTTISFGANSLRDMVVLDRNTISGHTPPGNVGIVDVTAKAGTAKDVLTGGFTYVDPKSSEGGASGGPLQGTLNVTVLDATPGNQGAPIPDVLVQIGTDPTTVFQGLTDSRGQITFSDPSLAKQQQVTVSKKDYLTVTVQKQESENLTVYLFFNGGTPAPPSFPPAPPPSIISGKVYGFKLPRPLTSTEVAWAEVWVAPRTLYACPPFARRPTAAQRDASGEKWRITQDGGTYTIYARRGYHAVYAVFGIFDKTIQSFKPLYMGVHRGVSVDPDNPATNIDIVLNMHLDQSVPITINNPPALPASTLLPVNETFAYFELGGEGVICMGKTSSAQPTFTYPNLPQVFGDSFVFLNRATISNFDGESAFFRREYGDIMTTGVDIGPMLGLVQLTTPGPVSRFNGNIGFAIGTGPTPDMYEVIYGILGLGGVDPLWQTMMPGTETSVTLPANALADIRTAIRQATIAAGQPLQTAILVIGSRSPRFSFSAWNYGQIGFGGLSLDWTSFTYTGAIVQQ